MSALGFYRDRGDRLRYDLPLLDAEDAAIMFLPRLTERDAERIRAFVAALVSEDEA
jgi:hypothetical protein